MKDFVVITKIGKPQQPSNPLGDGAYSTVYKVKRISDGEIYALKKVTVLFTHGARSKWELSQRKRSKTH